MDLSLFVKLFFFIVVPFLLDELPFLWYNIRYRMGRGKYIPTTPQVVLLYLIIRDMSTFYTRAVCASSNMR